MFNISKFTKPTWLSISWLGLMLFLAVFGSLLPFKSWKFVYEDDLGVVPFSPGHILGTDNNGYDLLSSLIAGTRMSVFIAVTAVSLGGLIGSALGITAAFVRGKVDIVMSTLFNVGLAVPNLVLALALVSVLATNVDINQSVPTWRRVMVLIISLTIVLIPILGRIARGATLSWSGRDFVTAARSMGMRDRQIIMKHIVPNVLPALIAVAFLAIGVVIIAEASLSILGVGIPDGASWGGMIARGRNDLEYSPHVLYVPVIVLAITVISTNHLGDVIRSSLDSRESKV
jgi:peptide/nickel transport system permease protein